MPLPLILHRHHQFSLDDAFHIGRLYNTHDSDRHGWTLSFKKVSIYLTHMEGQVFIRLALSYPHTTPHESLNAYLFGDDPDGGPDWDRANISVRIHRLRKLLLFLHLKIANDFGIGYRLRRVES